MEAEQGPSTLWSQGPWSTPARAELPLAPESFGPGLHTSSLISFSLDAVRINEAHPLKAVTWP